MIHCHSSRFFFLPFWIEGPLWRWCAFASQRCLLDRAYVARWEEVDKKEGLTLNREHRIVDSPCLWKASISRSYDRRYWRCSENHVRDGWWIPPSDDRSRTWLASRPPNDRVAGGDGGCQKSNCRARSPLTACPSSAAWCRRQTWVRYRHWCPAVSCSLFPWRSRRSSWWPDGWPNRQRRCRCIPPDARRSRACPSWCATVNLLWPSSFGCCQTRPGGIAFGPRGFLSRRTAPSVLSSVSLCLFFFFSYHNLHFPHPPRISAPCCRSWTEDKRRRRGRGWWIQSLDSASGSFDGAGRLKKGSAAGSVMFLLGLSLTVSPHSGLSSRWHTIASGTTWIFFFSLGKVCMMFFVKWTSALDANRLTKEK